MSTLPSPSLAPIGRNPDSSPGSNLFPVIISVVSIITALMILSIVLVARISERRMKHADRNGPRLVLGSPVKRMKTFCLWTKESPSLPFHRGDLCISSPMWTKSERSSCSLAGSEHPSQRALPVSIMERPDSRPVHPKFTIQSEKSMNNLGRKTSFACDQKLPEASEWERSEKKWLETYGRRAQPIVLAPPPVYRHGR
jgi:hypothetical protein